MPKHAAHGQGGHQQDGKDHNLVARNHGCRPPIWGASVRHSSSAVASVCATRAWYSASSGSEVTLWSESRSGANSIATAGQAMLSIPGNGTRPRVTVVPACINAEFSTPASARLRITHPDCAVFHGMNRAG